MKRFIENLQFFIEIIGTPVILVELFGDNFMHFPVSLPAPSIWREFSGSPCLENFWRFGEKLYILENIVKQ
jgi:hypothetical protein